MKRRIFTAGISKTKDKRYLQIDFLEESKGDVSILFDLHDKVDLAYNTISLIKSAKEEDGEEIMHEANNTHEASHF